MTDDKPRLLPCPFCGGEATIKSFNSVLKEKAVIFYYPICSQKNGNCIIGETGFLSARTDKDELLKMWNSKREQMAVPLRPTSEMINEGAQRLVSWSDGCVWPNSWSKMQVHAAKNEAERVWRSMWLAYFGGQDE